jgi:hypothetical protein
MGPTRDSQREQFWRQHIAAWNRSGQSIRGFCSVRHLSEASFYAWRRELRRRERECTQTPPLKFLPIQVRSEARIEIALPDGLVMRAPAAIEPTTLAALVAALRAKPC